MQQLEAGIERRRVEQRGCAVRRHLQLCRHCAALAPELLHLLERRAVIEAERRGHAVMRLAGDRVDALGRGRCWRRIGRRAGNNAAARVHAPGIDARPRPAAHGEPAVGGIETQADALRALGFENERRADLELAQLEALARLLRGGKRHLGERRGAQERLAADAVIAEFRREAGIERALPFLVAPRQPPAEKRMHDAPIDRSQPSPPRGRSRRRRCHG